MLHWNNTIWLIKNSDVTWNFQSESFFIVIPSYAKLKFDYDIGPRTAQIHPCRLLLKSSVENGDLLIHLNDFKVVLIIQFYILVLNTFIAQSTHKTKIVLHKVVIGAVMFTHPF